MQNNNLGVFYEIEDNVIMAGSYVNDWEEKDFLKNLKFMDQLRGSKYINKTMYLPLGAEVVIEEVPGYVKNFDGTIRAEMCKKVTIKYDRETDPIVKEEEQKRLKEFYSILEAKNLLKKEENE